MFVKQSRGRVDDLCNIASAGLLGRRGWRRLDIRGCRRAVIRLVVGIGPAGTNAEVELAYAQVVAQVQIAIMAVAEVANADIRAQSAVAEHIVHTNADRTFVGLVVSEGLYSDCQTLAKDIANADAVADTSWRWRSSALRRGRPQRWLR